MRSEPTRAIGLTSDDLSPSALIINQEVPHQEFNPESEEILLGLTGDCMKDDLVSVISIVSPLGDVATGEQ